MLGNRDMIPNSSTRKTLESEMNIEVVCTG